MPKSRNSKRLTDRIVERLAIEPQRYEVFDSLLPALVLRVGSSGAKSWTVVVRVNGRNARIGLGRFPGMNVATARERAQEMVDLAQNGIDPRDARRETEQAEIAASNRTVAAAVEQFVERHASTLRTGAAYRRRLRKDLVSMLGDKPIADVTMRDLKAVTAAVKKRGETAAVHTHAIIGSMWAWCLQHGPTELDEPYLTHNLMRDVPRPAKLKSRERVFSDAELQAMWRASGTLPAPYLAAVRILMLTGQRRGETSDALRWEWIDWEAEGGPVWRIPTEHNKSSREHLVPLSRAVVRILEDLGVRDRGRVLVGLQGGAVVPWDAIRQQLDAALAEAGTPVDDWGFHDFRRTARTGFARLRVPMEVAEKILNHSVGGRGGALVQVYDRFDYLDQRREALDAWAREVMRIVGPELRVVNG